MGLELYIDIYSLVLVHVALNLFLYQLSKPLKRIKDERVMNELKKIMSGYNAAVYAGDLIVWPAILTAIYPFYALVRLILKGKLFLLIKTFMKDFQLLKITILITLLWIASTLFALLHWFAEYAITFIVGLIVYIFLHKKEKKLLTEHKGA